MPAPFTCADVEKAVGRVYCCSSCHEDFDEYGMDYPLVEYHQDPKGDGEWAQLCCGGLRAMDECSDAWTRLLALRAPATLKGSGTGNHNGGEESK